MGDGEDLGGNEENNCLIYFYTKLFAISTEKGYLSHIIYATMSKLEEFLSSLLGRYKFSFSKKDAMQALGKDNIAIKRAIDRAKDKGLVFSLRKGFYLNIPPRYKLLGKLPIQLYISDLFKSIDRQYYISLLSAAKFHGVSHHALQKDYVITQPPAIRDIDKAVYRIDFHVKSSWPVNNIELKKSEAGRFAVASIALTIVDLINYQNRLGGISNIVTTIAELTEDLNFEDLDLLLEWYTDISDIQRLGYIFEWLEVKSQFIERLESCLSNYRLQEILLVPGQSINENSIKNKWKVNVNAELELEI